MNFKTTLALFIVLLGLGGVWLLTSSKPPTVLTENENTNSTGADEDEPLFEDKPLADEWVALAIERPGQPTLGFTRPPKSAAKSTTPDAPREWRMTEPVAAPAQSWQVDSLVSTYATLRVKKLGDKSGIDARAAGFESPLATLTFTTAAGAKHTVQVGKKAAIGQETYVRRGTDGPILVAEMDLSRELKKPTADFRARRLLSFKSDDVTKIETTIGGREYRLVKSGDAWEIESPVAALAERDKVRQLIDKISYLNVADFIDDSPKTLAAYGFDPAYQTIKVTVVPSPKVDPTASAPATAEAPPAPETIALLIGAPADSTADKRFARLADQPWVVSLRKTDIEPLAPNLSELRDTRITRVAVNEAKTLTLESGGATATLKLVDGRWSADGDLDKLELPAVQELLEAFADARAIDFADPASVSDAGLSPPRAKITVRTADDRTVALSIGAMTRSGRNAYARRNDDPELLIVSQQQAERLAVAPLALRSRDVVSEPSLQVTKVAIEQPRLDYVLSRSGPGSWVLESPAGAILDAAAAGALVNDLSQLRARRVVARGGAENFGLNPPETVIRFTVTPPATSQPATDSAPAEPVSADPPREHMLRVGRVAGAPYCMIDDDPFVFELDATVYSTLTGELLTRRLFSFPAAEIRRIKLTMPGEQLEFERQEKGWKYTPDPYVKLQTAKVDELAGALANLAVESYTAWSGADPNAIPSDSMATVEIRSKDDAVTIIHLAINADSSGAHNGIWMEKGRGFRLGPTEAKSLLNKTEHYLESAAPSGALPPPNEPG